MDEADVGEVLAYRVVSTAHRRRGRRLVVAGLLALIIGSGAAVALTHRSGAGRPPVALGRTSPAHSLRAAERATRAEIYALARAHYRGPAGAPHSRTRIVLGPLRLRGTSAELPVDVLCGPMCGHGEQLVLRRVADRWQITAVKRTWIS